MHFPTVQCEVALEHAQAEMEELVDLLEVQHRVQRGARVLLHKGGINNKCSISSDLTFSRDLRTRVKSIKK